MAYGRVRHRRAKAAKASYKQMVVNLRAVINRRGKDIGEHDYPYYATVCVVTNRSADAQLKANAKIGTAKVRKCEYEYGRTPTKALKGALKNLARVLK